jgi:hypothetical protein
MEQRDRERAVVDALRTHLERWWGSCDELVWQRGPMRRDCPGFRILRARPDDHGLWLYASAGASLLRQVEGTGHELFLVSPTEAPELVELVTMAAHYAVFGSHEGVHEGHTLNIGRPWLPGSECDHLYLSTAYLRPRQFALLKHDFGPLTCCGPSPSPRRRSAGATSTARKRSSSSWKITSSSPTTPRAPLVEA